MSGNKFIKNVGEKLNTDRERSINQTGVRCLFHRMPHVILPNNKKMLNPLSNKKKKQ